jgi:hypothetical protein
LNKETKIFASVFMTFLLLLGFSSSIGNQFFSVYAQSDEDSADEQIEELADTEPSEASSGEDNITAAIPGNLTNQTVLDLNTTVIDDTSQDNILPEDRDVLDEAATEIEEDSEGTSIPDGFEELPMLNISEGEQTEGQDNQDLQNVSDEASNEELPMLNISEGEQTEGQDNQDLQNVSDEASNLSNVEMPSNFTESTESFANPILEPENLSGLQQEEPDQELGGRELQNESDFTGSQGQQTTNVVPDASLNGTNETSLAEGISGIDLLSENVTEDEPLPPEADIADNQSESVSALPSLNASAQAPSETDSLAQIMPAEEILGNLTSEEIDAAASDIVGITNATSAIENNQVSNIQNVINSIALGSAQSGANPQQIASQISKEIAAKPKGPVAKAVQTLAGEYSKGNSDEIDIAAKQIGTLIAKGNNIQQTLVQVTNNVVNNIQNIKTSIENYDKIVVNPKISSNDKNIIQQTINVIKKSKTEVDVPRIHIKFHTHERNLVLRILSTNNYKYEMPFSKYNGAFKLDDDQFRVKVLSGDGSVQSASVAKMFKSGKIGDREFLDKDVRNGKVFFSLDDVNDGKYLLELYIKLSNGSIGTFARGSVTIR